MIRIATKEDAKALLDIYKYYVEQTTITFEYETPSVEEFERRIENTLKKYPYLVEEESISGRRRGWENLRIYICRTI